jgi:superfamily I DNA/RNA helicase
VSDHAVAKALRSERPLVLVEAAAGCGKTFQAAEYAKDLCSVISPGRLLILTHTHAACDVFAARTKALGRRVTIRTIDSLINEIGTAYHAALGLPADVSAWARRQGTNGFDSLAGKVASLLRRSPSIAGALAERFPVVICDEHQDSSVHQHAVVMSIHHAGARLRVLGDPMQNIFKKEAERQAAEQLWSDLSKRAGNPEKLDTPHRWQCGAEELGIWIRDARNVLQREKR